MRHREQRIALGLGHLIEDEAGKIVEHGFPRGGRQHIATPLGAAESLHHQRHTCRPPARLLVQRLQEPVVGDVSLQGERADLIEGELQVFPAAIGYRAVGSEPCEERPSMEASCSA